MAYAPPDYVKQITEAKELESKQYQATSQWHQNYGWVQDEKSRLNGEYQEIKEELKEAVKATGEPSFAQPLVRALFNNVDDMNNDTDLCAQMSIENENKINANNPNNNNRQNERPAMTRTTNAEYGRFGYTPLEDGGAAIRRIAYSKHHKIGRLNEKYGISGRG